MRKVCQKQLGLNLSEVSHLHAKELEVLSDLLDADLGILALITQDLVDEGVDLETSRPGMTEEQTLRAALYRHLHGLAYEALAFQLADSRTAARFCRLRGKAPSSTALQRNIKRIKPETWEALNRRLVLAGRPLGKTSALVRV